MGIDIKLPIGLMFTIFGLMLALYGLFTNGDEALYSRSLGVNINLWCGLGMLAFGVIMLVFSLKSKKKQPLPHAADPVRQTK
jgi:hypothetical protein